MDGESISAEYICQYGNFHNNCAKCDLAQMLLEAGLYSYQIRDILRKMDSGGINVRYEMPYCKVTEDRPADQPGWAMWCTTHNKMAKHCGPDDESICEDYAKKMGCNCCPELPNKRQD